MSSTAVVLISMCLQNWPGDMPEDAYQAYAVYEDPHRMSSTHRVALCRKMALLVLDQGNIPV